MPKERIKMSLWWDMIIYKLAEKQGKKEQRPMSFILNRWTAAGARAEGHHVPEETAEPDTAVVQS